MQVDRNKNEIGLVAETKLDSDEYTKAEIVARINDSSSQVKIEADSIDLNGVVTANNNFKILTDGSMECQNATINYGSINLIDDGTLGSTHLSIQSPNAYCNQVSTGSFYKYHLDSNNQNEIYIDARTGGIHTYKVEIDQNNETTTTQNASIRPDSIIISDNINSKYTLLEPNRIITPKIKANNIQSGTASITNSNAGTTITFDTPFDTTPNVVLTPISTASGNITIKIIDITTTYFKAYNSTSSSVDCCWIAMK